MPGAAPACLCATVSKMTPSHGLRSRGPHTLSATRPPGPQHARISRARAGRDRARASAPRGRPRRRNEPSGSSICSRSSTARARCGARRRRALGGDRVISGATSETTTSPSAPTRAAAARPTLPGPQASSSTRSPGRGLGGSSSARVDPRAARVDVAAALPAGATPSHISCRWSRTSIARLAAASIACCFHGDLPHIRLHSTSNEFIDRLSKWPSLSSPPVATSRHAGASRPPRPGARSSRRRSGCSTTWLSGHVDGGDAAEAGVALKTVYVAFETKSGVLRALWHLRLRGDEDAAGRRRAAGTARCSTSPTRNGTYA